MNSKKMAIDKWEFALCMVLAFAVGIIFMAGQTNRLESRLNHQKQITQEIKAQRDSLWNQLKHAREQLNTVTQQLAKAG
jgi:septal ring factor EnvC (AmiA/AmiB activator)